MDVIEVAIGPINGADMFKVDVLRSRAGEASVNVALDAMMLLARTTQLQQAVLASAVPRRAVLSETERPLREVGAMLFSALLGSGEVAGRYRASAALAADQGQGLRVVLRIDSALLTGLPWEAMYDDAVGAYVCRREQLVRHVPVASVAAPLTVQPPLRILGVVSSPRGLPALDVEKEKEQLTRALAGLYNDGRIIVHWVPTATWAKLQDLLLSQEWHLVHFIGHGDFDLEREEGVLALVGEDGRRELVEANRLVDLLRQARPMPRLVVLNSCSGARIEGPDLFSGTAAALVRGGVSAVAAMQYEISDSAAVAFARGFYTAIAHGRGVDDATSSGRVAILGTGARTLEWVTPVLYLRGDDSHLFTLSPANLSSSVVPRVPMEAEWAGSSADGPDDGSQSGTTVTPGAVQAHNPTTKNPPTAEGRGSKVLQIDLPRGEYLMNWSTEGSGLFILRHESAGEGDGVDIVAVAAPDPSSGERMVRIVKSGRQVFSLQTDSLTWQLWFTSLKAESAHPSADGPDDGSQSGTTVTPGAVQADNPAITNPLAARGHGSDVLEMNFERGTYRMNWSTEGSDVFIVQNESAINGQGESIVAVAAPNPDSGVRIVRIADSGPQIISVRADNLLWELAFTPL